MKGLLVFTIIVIVIFVSLGLFVKNTMVGIKEAKGNPTACIAQGHTQSDCLLEQMGQQRITNTNTK